MPSLHHHTWIVWSTLTSTMTDLPSSSTSEKVAGKSSNYYETLSSEPAEENDNEPKFSKKDRKKLKKLRKRSTLVQVEAERSGLLTRSEYEEYQNLLELDKEDKESHSQTTKEKEDNDAKSPPAPVSFSTPRPQLLVNLRKKCADIEKVEGATHRDLLSWLLHQKFDNPNRQQQSRKRNRDGQPSKPQDASVAIPHWASIHNPGICEQVAVLEVHVLDEKIDAYREFLESCRGKGEQDKAFPNTQIGVATKWFQGHLPKSMSESLLYFSNVKSESKKKKPDDESGFPPTKEFIKRLETMVLSTEDMNEQGYPVAIPPSNQKELNTTNSGAAMIVSKKEMIQSLDSISLDNAKEYVAAFGVRVESQNEEDKSPYISTPSMPSSVDSDAPSTDGASVRVLGLDCEMVLTTVGSELARVTLIEFDEFVGPKESSKTRVLLDCLVRPENRILDYLTKHSGITAAMLAPVETQLQQVQCALASFLTPKDILVGHSLENDLRALHYIHPRVVDTSMIFRPVDQNKRFKFSLRHLSGTLLKKTIQTGSHCSEEDAQVALDLALLKALRGDDLRVPGFGDNQRQSLLRQQFVIESVAAFIGPNHWLERHITKCPTGAHALNYDSPTDCKKAMLAWMTNKRKAHLTWSKIELEGKTESGPSSLEVFKSLVVSSSRETSENTLSLHFTHFCLAF